MDSAVFGFKIDETGQAIGNRRVQPQETCGEGTYRSNLYAEQNYHIFGRDYNCMESAVLL